MSRAVPSTILHSALRYQRFRSAILASSDLLNFIAAQLITFFCLVRRNLFQTSSFFSKTGAGGVFVMKVKERSSNTVISTGMIKPVCWGSTFIELLNKKPWCLHQLGQVQGLQESWSSFTSRYLIYHFTTFSAFITPPLFQLLQPE